MIRTIPIALLVTTMFGGVARADDPTPPPPPAPPAPEEKKPDEPKPEQPKPEETKPEEPKPEDTKPAVTPAPKSEPTPTTGGGSVPVFDNTSSTTSVSSSSEDGGKKSVHIAVELTGSGGKLGDPYVVYRGWELQNGASKGTRLEAQLSGIMVAYELTSMSNGKACADACVSGSFGSTTFQELEVGYRFRLSMIGPVRPYLSGSLGGVLGNSGDWSTKSGSSKGGVARLGAGVEIPFAKKFFASGNINYRLIITDNPYRDPDLETAGKALVDMSDEPSGNFAQDAHLISVNLGVGVSL